jgi:addiction module RelE/StbE family toxin
MRLVWRPRALADRRAIMAYIARDNPAAAIALDEAIESCAERVCDGDLLHKPGRLEGTHEAVVRRNYIVVYTRGSETVTILRVVHAAQQWPP